MKWEKVKEAVACDVYTMIAIGRSVEVMTTMLVDMIASEKFELAREGAFKKYADKAWEVVMNWDIRQVHKLRELFPESFPRSLRGKSLVAEYDEDGDWCVYKAGGES